MLTTYVSARQLANFFYNPADEKKISFREDSINLCYLYISEGQLDRKNYQKIHGRKVTFQKFSKIHFSKYKFYFAMAVLVLLVVVSPYIVPLATLYFNPSDMPIVTEQNQVLLNDAIEKLEDLANDDWRNRDMDCWNTSEIFMSMRKNTSDTSNFYFFEKSVIASYDTIFPGWKSAPAVREIHPTDMRATAWVLLTENIFSDTICYTNLIEKILSEQMPDGAWTNFKIREAGINKEYASTYSTCFTVLMLNQVLQKTNDPKFKQRIVEAIDKSKSWLIKARIDENGSALSQWKDFPYQRSGKRSRAISAWVIHTLNKINYSKVKEINQNWLADFPSNSKNIFVSEDCDLDYPNREYNERTKVPTNTAIIIATCDAYSTTSLYNKRKINILVNEFIYNVSQANYTKLPDDSYVFDFRRADLLVALKYIKGNKLF
jgi:hypothetical protein